MTRQQSASPALTVTASTAQHIGDRAEQQDRVDVLHNPEAEGCALAVIADGMGGRSGGSVAADNVIRTSQQRFAEYSPDQQTAEDFLNSLVTELHTVLRLTRMTTDLQPHSTLATVLVQPGRVDWCHVGDSRVYVIRDRRLVHCTTDDTYEQMLVRDGKMTRERARLHPSAHLLVNVLGADRAPTATLGRLDDPRAGDLFLLCSDGLWNYFHAGELVLVLQQADLEAAAATLIERARERAEGQGDNISLAIVRLAEPAPQTGRVRASAMRA